MVHLPQIEANLAVLGVLADVLGVIRVVLRVVDLRVHPGALVVRVVNLPVRNSLNGTICDGSKQHGLRSF